MQRRPILDFMDKSSLDTIENGALSYSKLNMPGFSEALALSDDPFRLENRILAHMPPLCVRCCSRGRCEWRGIAGSYTIIPIALIRRPIHSVLA